MSNTRETDGFIYFATSFEDPEMLVKIGFSKNDPKHRLGDLQIGCPIKLRLIMAIEGKRKDENRFHLLFCRDRVHGEWFRPSEKLIDFIIQTIGEKDFRSCLRAILEEPITIRGCAKSIGLSEQETISRCRYLQRNLKRHLKRKLTASTRTGFLSYE